MQLVWFKTADLRVNDNSALYHACSKGQTIGVFVITPRQYQQHHDAEIKQDFWYRNLLDLSSSLNKLNIPLKILQCDSFAELPEELLKFSQQHEISAVHFNRQYEANESELEQRVAAICRAQHIETHAYTDQVIFPPGSILTGNETYYTVFTPFKKKFLSHFAMTHVQCYPQPEKQAAMNVQPDDIKPWLEHTNIRGDLWPAGEAEAVTRLTRFIKAKINAYQEQRDFPAINGTSTLSPYLAAGVISIRYCFRTLQTAFAKSESVGVATWRSELIWREFYKHILIGFPRVSRHRPFKLETERLSWHENAEHLAAWKKGMTGVPIVDAAMRQMNQTGWMHNRLRMVVAMFLSKNLFLDWRLGEKYFMQKLIDGDLSANNGGWQWSASTGTDAAPDFRIFNPVSQSRRFDPDGDFIRRFVPELAALDAKAIHEPWNSRDKFTHVDYPAAIVDLKSTRQYAIDQFKQLQA